MKTFLTYLDENSFGPALDKMHPVGDLNAADEKEVKKSDLDQIEKYADKIFASLGIDVEFTRHFLDRVNDSRNVKQITPAELTRLFKQSYKKYGKKIAKLGPDAEAVINDMKTNINMPFVLNLKRGELELVAKTVMRKKNFQTSGPKLSFEQFKEEPRIPRKKGQPAGSDKHSDLYTDENPKGTIQGLKFATVKDAKSSVSKIDNSSKTHAHKVQAAVAMEQRAKEMGKSAEAAIYRKFINQMKKKTKEMNKESLIDTLQKEMKIDEYYLLGTDHSARHTMSMTPGQPIQNFRKYSETIKMADIEKFRNEEETIDKYKKRYKERYKEELEKAVERMKKEL